MSSGQPGGHIDRELAILRIRLVQRFKRCGELNHPRQSRATKINDIHALYYIRETKRSAKRTIPHLVGWSVVLLVGWQLMSKALITQMNRAFLSSACST